MKHSSRPLTNFGAGLVAALVMTLTVLAFPGLAFAGSQTRSSELERAQSEIDRMFDILRKNPEADWETLQKKLLPMARNVDSEMLSREDLETLDRYVRENGQDLSPLLKRLSRQTRHGQVAISGSAGSTCYTYCIAIIQFECGTDRPFGLCLGGWDCYEGRGAHICLEEAGGDIGNDSSCKNDSECPPGWGCATWVFKENECVEKCDSNSDCPSGQKCKKPLGTSFKRCK